MRGQILKSYCKINLFLSVGRKLKRYKLHNIQSLIFFINLYDQIQIKKINSSKDNIKFFGKFSNYVNSMTCNNKSCNCKNCNCDVCNCDGSKTCSCLPESISCCCNN